MKLKNLNNVLSGPSSYNVWDFLKENKMRKILYFISIAFLLGSCATSGGNGELVGVLGRPVWYQTDPYGMLYIPAGAFNMGQSDQDVPLTHYNETKTVSVGAFYMDQTEITNNEYRQFVNWVRDSIARRILGQEFPEEFLVETYDDELEVKDEADWQLNWNSRFEYISFNPSRGHNSEYAPLLAQMFLNESERFYQRKEFDTRKFMFEYYWIDLKEAANKGRPLIKRISNTEADEDEDHRVKMKNPNMPFPAEPGQVRGKDLNLGFRNSKGQNNAIRGHEDRSRFIIKEVINVYPDTLCWIHDFTYADNEHMSNMYFWHPAYDDYPVVGVTWQQCNAFNVWRTQLIEFMEKISYVIICSRL